jgi:hypothetical protein
MAGRYGRETEPQVSWLAGMEESDSKHPPVDAEGYNFPGHRPSYSTECHGDLDGSASIVDIATSATTSTAGGCSRLVCLFG